MQCALFNLSRCFGHFEQQSVQCALSETPGESPTAKREEIRKRLRVHDGDKVTAPATASAPVEAETAPAQAPRAPVAADDDFGRFFFRVAAWVRAAASAAASAASARRFFSFNASGSSVVSHAPSSEAFWMQTSRSFETRSPPGCLIAASRSGIAT